MKCGPQHAQFNFFQESGSWTIIKLTNAAVIDFKRWLTPSYNSLVELELSKCFIQKLPTCIPWDMPHIVAFVVNNCQELAELSVPDDVKPACRKKSVAIFCLLFQELCQLFITQKLL